MAINLWKLGGQPTAFNPLPTGWDNQVNVGIGQCVVSFKAKSPTNAVLKVADVGNEDFMQNITLSTEFNDYKYEVTSKSSQGFYFYDLNSVGNIIIEDIQLVRKPLGLATINGIDGFTSGKWSLHANARVIDDETLELNATGAFQDSIISMFDAKPNTTYTLSSEGGQKWKINEYDSSGTFVVGHNDISSPYTFTTKSNTKKIDVRTRNGEIGLFTFKKPMLVLGSQPIPYEKKRGERMVLPVPKKNLSPAFSAYKQSGLTDNMATNIVSERKFTIDTTVDAIRFVDVMIDAEPNTDYTISVGSTNGRVKVFTYNGSAYVGVYGSHVDGNKRTFRTPSDVKKVKINLESMEFSGLYAFEDVQLEKGAIATPYEPYAAQVNKKARGLVPVKNMIPTDINEWERGTIGADSSVSLRMKGFSEINPLLKYVAQAQNYSSYAIAYYDSSKSLISQSENVTVLTIPTNARFVKFRVSNSNLFSSENPITPEKITNFEPQLEEGSTATPFEPYKLSNPKAKQGLVMDGRTNYVQLPSMTMDSIEIDCLIDSVQPNSTAKVLDARTGLENGYVNADPVYSIGSWASAEGRVKGERTRLKVYVNTPITDNVNIFSNYGGAEHTKGIIYGIKCYLNGQVVASYDAENLQSIQGNTIYDDAIDAHPVNLLPSFDSGEWSLHPNFKVYGKYVGQLVASFAHQASKYVLSVEKNTDYIIYANDIKGTVRYYVSHKDGAPYNDLLSSLSVGSPGGYGSFNSGNYEKLYIFLSNTTTGSFDFTNPTLFKVPQGNHGTINGVVQPSIKKAKRVLYAKR